MASSLESLLAEGVISEIYSRLKSGKEADVYAVCYADQVVAAKVYKDRAQRSFKSNSAYKEGRAVRNSRSQRAMERGSKFGQEAAEDAWKAAEATALYKLHAAGVRVPTPVMFLEGVLFMELVRGADGEPAPRLIDTELSAAEAHAAYLDMLSQLVRILSCDLIHGDLSPYNVLWAESGATIIDFPQIVSAAQNSNSESFFLRDARNILGHFAALDPSLRARVNSDPREIWRAYVRRELTPEFLPTGRAPAPERPRFQNSEPRAAQLDRGGAAGFVRADRGPRSDLGGANGGWRPEHGAQNRGPRSEQGGQNPRPRAAHGDQYRSPNSDFGGQNRGPRTDNGNQNRGPRTDNGNQNRGPRTDNGNQNRGPRTDNGNQNRGPRTDNGNQNRGPRTDNGNQNRGPRTDNGNQNRGPRPMPAGESGRQPSGPRLQMASARANVASQGARRPQRDARRGPEVIVLTRRAPDSTTVAAAPEPRPVQASPRAPESDQDATRGRRRR